MNSGELNDSGFSHIPRKQGERLINKNGTSNVKKEGLSFVERFSMYHALTSMNWRVFFLCLFLCFIAINIIFAFIYLLIGIKGIGGIEMLTFKSSFLKSFYFSTQSLTTVGYGQLYPKTPLVSFVAAVESFVGLLSFAMATGLLYGRFSKPTAKLIFSDNLLFAPFKEGEALMIRLANPKDSQIIDVTADVIFTYLDFNEGQATRKFFNLPLEIDRINMLATSWTLVHPINEESPLFELSKNTLIKSDPEVFIQIQGFDVTYNQSVNTRTSFKVDEFVWNAKFKKILKNDNKGAPVIDLGELSSYNKL